MFIVVDTITISVLSFDSRCSHFEVLDRDISTAEGAVQAALWKLESDHTLADHMTLTPAKIAETTLFNVFKNAWFFNFLNIFLAL